MLTKLQNQTIELKITEALSDFIQQDGRLKLSNTSDADAIIEITLTKYVNTPIVSDQIHVNFLQKLIFMFMRRQYFAIEFLGI